MCVGVLRIGEQLVGRGLLDDPAEIHDRDAARDVPHDREIVGNEEIGEAELALEMFEQVDHLALDRNVERGDGLVAHDHIGLDGERPCNADALALAAGKLVRIAQRHVGEEPDELQQLGNTIGNLGFRHDVMDAHGLADDLPDGHARIERGVGILEDHLHLLAYAGHLGARERGEVRAGEQDLAAGRIVEAEHEAAERGLAAAGLADDCERLAAAHVEGDTIDRADQRCAAAEKLPPAAKMLHESLGRENDIAAGGRVHAASPPTCTSSGTLKQAT